MIASFLRLGAGLLVVLGVVGAPLLAVTYPFGAPAGFAGDIVDPASGPQTCGVEGCHASFPLNSGTGSVTIDAPAEVAPGETVPVTVTVVNTTEPAPGGTGRRQGFTAVVRDAAGGFAGSVALSDAAATRFSPGSTSYVTHTSAGTQRTSWTFDWTAPAEGTATIYAAGNAANGGDLPAEPGNNAAGDYIYTATRTVTVGTTAADERPGAVGLALGLPHPNPAAGPAVVRVTLAEAATVTVALVDGRGRTVLRVAEGPMAAGTHPVALPAQRLAPGTYFVTVRAAGEQRTQPLVVAR